MADKQTILVFGGNGFIGAEVVDYLLTHNDKVDLILVNRDNWKDWDLNESIKPRIKENIVLDGLDGEKFKLKAVFGLSDYFLDQKTTF